MNRITLVVMAFVLAIVSCKKEARKRSDEVLRDIVEAIEEVRGYETKIQETKGMERKRLSDVKMRDEVIEVAEVQEYEECKKQEIVEEVYEVKKKTSIEKKEEIVDVKEGVEESVEQDWKKQKILDAVREVESTEAVEEIVELDVDADSTEGSKFWEGYIPTDKGWDPDMCNSLDEGHLPGEGEYKNAMLRNIPSGCQLRLRACG